MHMDGTQKRRKPMQNDMLELLEKCERWGIEIEPKLREAIQMQYALDQLECRKSEAEFYDEKRLFEFIIHKFECKRAELMEGIE
jgi:hypothetical protein